jgi:hypothetical protein
MGNPLLLLEGGSRRMSATVPLVQLDEVGGVESPVAGARRAGGDAGGGRTHRREWMRAGEAGSGCVRARRRRGILRRCGRASGGGLGQGAAAAVCRGGTTTIWRFGGFGAGCAGWGNASDDKSLQAYPRHFGVNTGGKFTATNRWAHLSLPPAERA